LAKLLGLLLSGLLRMDLYEECFFGERIPMGSLSSLLSNYAFRVANKTPSPSFFLIVNPYVAPVGVVYSET